MLSDRGSETVVARFLMLCTRFPIF